MRSSSPTAAPARRSDRHVGCPESPSTLARILPANGRRDQFAGFDPAGLPGHSGDLIAIGLTADGEGHPMRLEAAEILQQLRPACGVLNQQCARAMITCEANDMLAEIRKCEPRTVH